MSTATIAFNTDINFTEFLSDTLSGAALFGLSPELALYLTSSAPNRSLIVEGSMLNRVGEGVANSIRLKEDGVVLFEISGLDLPFGQLNAAIASFASGNTAALDALLSGISLTFDASSISSGVVAIDGSDNASGDVALAGPGGAVFRLGDGVDSYFAGSGIDTISFATETGGAGANVNLNTGVVRDSYGNNEVLVTSAGQIEWLEGSMQGDTLIGSGQDNVIWGLSGADTLGGAGGIDTLTYAHDATWGGLLGVTVELGQGFAIDGFGFTDTLSGFENVIGTEADDSLAGTSAANILIGRGGDDIFYGGAGDDQFIGGEGNDTASYLYAPQRVAVFLNRNDHLGDGVGRDTFDSIENLFGSSFADRLVGDDAANVLKGAMGDDVVIGQGGDDLLVGDRGNDTLEGGGGFDTLLGGRDNDIMRGDGGGDVMFGDAGNDNMQGGNGLDFMSGGDGDDVMFGNRGIDNMYGGDGQDTMIGGGNPDYMFGEDGDDRVIGGSGNDRIEGGLGSDTLIGGGGDGSGDGKRDTFVFRAEAVSERGVDVIKDFENGKDRIEISGMGYTSFADLYADARDVGTAMQINFDFSGLLIVENFSLAEFNSADVIF